VATAAAEAEDAEAEAEANGKRDLAKRVTNERTKRRKKSKLGTSLEVDKTRKVQESTSRETATANARHRSIEPTNRTLFRY
jgi:uncharacterized sporulation protein YeaH/YhbH (DUF444 family)